MCNNYYNELKHVAGLGELQDVTEVEYRKVRLERVVADRTNRRTVMVALDALSAVTVLVCAATSSSSPDSRLSKETCSAVSMAGKCTSARTGARADCKLSASWAKAV